MSKWIEPLKLKRPFSIGINENEPSTTYLPDWAAFLIWSGWWMRRTLLNNARVFFVILLPARECCSSICCLGAMLGSIGYRNIDLRWNDIISLPKNTTVYLRFPGSKKDKKNVPIEAKLLDTINIKNQQSRKVFIKSKNKRFKNGTLFLFKNQLEKYQITLTPHLSKHKEGSLSKLDSFYRLTSPDYDSTWINDRSTECLIVTSRAGWTRENKDIKLFQSSTNFYKLSNLLMVSNIPDTDYSRLLIASPKSPVCEIDNIPLSILDGIEALKSWESIRSTNTIVILNSNEYNENAESILALFSSARENSLVPVPENTPDKIPTGIQTNIFAIPKA